jgi:hypothetical protein
LAAAVAVDVMVVVDVTVVVGRKVHSGVAVAVVMEVERSLEVVEAEIEMEADSVVALRSRNWSNSTANTHLPGLAFVLAARRQPVAVDKTGVVADAIRLVIRKRSCQALGLGIGSTGSHMLFEDGAQIELEVRKLGNLLAVARIGAVMLFDLMGSEIVVAES